MHAPRGTHLPPWPDNIVRTVCARLLSITTVFWAAKAYSPTSGAQSAMWAPYLQEGDKEQRSRGQRRQAGGARQRRQGLGAGWERRRPHRTHQLGDGGTKICCMMQGAPWLQPGCAEASAGAAGGPGSSAGGDVRC